MALQQPIFGGNSIMQGAAENLARRLGGKGTIPQRVTEWLSAYVGRIAGAGFIPACTSRSDWAFSGQDGNGNTNWTAIEPTDSFDRAPWFADAGANMTKRAWHGSGSGDNATWSQSADLHKPVDEFTIALIDKASGGSPSWRVGGTGSWNAFPSYTPAQDDKIVLCRVDQALDSDDIVEVRCANAAGTSQSAALLGIYPWYEDQSTADGICGHNIAIGGTQLHQLMLSTSGDRRAWFKSAQIRLVNGARSHLENNTFIFEWLNDDALVGAGPDTSTLEADIDALFALVDPLGPLLFCNMYEAFDTFWDDTTKQAPARAAIADKADEHGFALVDWFALLQKLGFGGVGAQNAALAAKGWLDLPGVVQTHPREPLAKMLARWTFDIAHRDLYSAFPGPPIYTSKAKQPSVVPIAKQAAHVATAGMQIAPVPI